MSSICDTHGQHLEAQGFKSIPPGNDSAAVIPEALSECSPGQHSALVPGLTSAAAAPGSFHCCCPFLGLIVHPVQGQTPVSDKTLLNVSRRQRNLARQVESEA